MSSAATSWCAGTWLDVSERWGVVSVLAVASEQSRCMVGVVVGVRCHISFIMDVLQIANIWSCFNFESPWLVVFVVAAGFHQSRQLRAIEIYCRQASGGIKHCMRCGTGEIHPYMGMSRHHIFVMGGLPVATHNADTMHLKFQRDHPTRSLTRWPSSPQLQPRLRQQAHRDCVSSVEQEMICYLTHSQRVFRRARPRV